MTIHGAIGGTGILSPEFVAEAMGMSLPHSALCPSGTMAWKVMARRSSLALTEMVTAGRTLADADGVGRDPSLGLGSDDDD